MPTGAEHGVSSSGAAQEWLPHKLVSKLCNTVVLLKVDKHTLPRRAPPTQPRDTPSSGGTFYILLVRAKFSVTRYCVLHAPFMRDSPPRSPFFPFLLTPLCVPFRILLIFPRSRRAIFPTFRRTSYYQRNMFANLSDRRYYLTEQFIHLTNWQFGNLTIARYTCHLPIWCDPIETSISVFLTSLPHCAKYNNSQYLG